MMMMMMMMMMMHHLCRPTLDHRRTRSSRTRPSPRPRRTHASSSTPFAFAFAFAFAHSHPFPCPRPFDPSVAHSATDRLCRCPDAIDRSIDRIDRMDGWMDGWIDRRVIFTGRDSTCMGNACRARARETLLERVCGRTVCVSLSLSLSLSLSSHDSWMSPRVSWPPRRRGPTHADARLSHDARTHHDLRRRRHEDDDESDVLLFARLSRRVDHREQRCRSEAGASDAGARPNARE